MNTAEAERRVRALAEAAALPQEYDAWPGVHARVRRVRRRRLAVRIAAAAVAVVAVGAAITIPLSLGRPPNAMAVARRAATAASTGAGVPPFSLTEVTTNRPTGFQPEPPPPRIAQRIDYAGPAHWRSESVITEPFHEGTQTITQIREGAKFATVAAGQVTVTRARGQGLPFLAWQRGALRELLAAGSASRCAPSASLSGDGPAIDGRPTVVLHLGPSPCPSADVPQADGPATFWLDRQTYLVLRAELHGPRNRLAETIRVTSLQYHAAFPAGTFRLPRPSHTQAPCPARVPLPDLAALRRAMASPPLLPARLPDGLRTGAIAPAGATSPAAAGASRCKITGFTVTYVDTSGRPAVQLYEAPQASPSVRFPGKAVTIRPGLTGTLSGGTGMTILWWIQDGRYCALQSGGLTAGVRLTGIPTVVLLQIAASLHG